MQVTQDIDDATGVVVLEVYRKNGARHRDGDQPAVIQRDAATGRVVLEEYLRDGAHHRDGDQPAIIQRDPVNGRVVLEEYFRDGVLHPHHRDGGQPAIIQRDAATGTVVLEEYYKDGVLHRDGDQPALIERDAATGTVVKEEYWKDGKQIPEPVRCAAPLFSQGPRGPQETPAVPKTGDRQIPPLKKHDIDDDDDLYRMMGRRTHPTGRPLRRPRGFGF